MIFNQKRFQLTATPQLNIGGEDGRGKTLHDDDAANLHANMPAAAHLTFRGSMPQSPDASAPSAFAPDPGIQCRSKFEGKATREAIALASAADVLKDCNAASTFDEATFPWTISTRPFAPGAIGPVVALDLGQIHHESIRTSPSWQPALRRLRTSLICLP